MTTFDLRTIKLRSGEQLRDVREVELEPLELGGERYVPVPERPEAGLTITRVSSGLLFELELEARLVGPCMRCLEDALVTVDFKSREYQATSPGEGDDLRSPYLKNDLLDLSAWARDVVAVSVPDKILCRPECAGLCPICGRDLNREPHEHPGEESDPRWAALAELKERL